MRFWQIIFILSPFHYMKNTTIPSTYTLKIYHDDCAENPWTSWDCLPPLFTEWWRDFWDNEYNLSVSILIDLIPKSKLNKNVLALFNLDEKENHPIYRHDYNKKSDFVIDSLREHVENTQENLITLANYLNLPYYAWTSRGYSQGDCIDCILVSLPDYQKERGTKLTHNEEIQELKNTSKLFDAWAWWDVYGFRLFENVPLYHKDWTLSEETEEKEIDSCWWFYGDDWLNQIFNELPQEHKHLFEDAKSNIIFTF